MVFNRRFYEYPGCPSRRHTCNDTVNSTPPFFLILPNKTSGPPLAPRSRSYKLNGARGSEMFPHQESRSKISLMIVELFHSHNMIWTEISSNKKFQACTPLLLDRDKIKMALRARKVTRTFEKRVPRNASRSRRQIPLSMQTQSNFHMHFFFHNKEKDYLSTNIWRRLKFYKLSNNGQIVTAELDLPFVPTMMEQMRTRRLSLINFSA